MHDQVEAYLRSLNTSDRARAAAWDAVYSVKDDAQAQQMLSALPFSDDVKATLWDARKGSSPDVAQPTTPEQAPSATSRFFSNAGEMLNPVTAVKGLVNAVAHPIDTGAAIYNAQAEQFGKAREDYNQGRYSEMLGHGAAGIVPLLGPAAAQAGEQIASGDVAGGLGKGAGLLTATVAAPAGVRAASGALKAPAQAVGRRLYQSALKPTKATLNDVRPVAGMTPQQTLLQTGLDEGIPVTPRGVRKVENLIDSLNAEVQSRVQSAAQRGATVDPATVDRAIADVAKDFTNQINAQPDLNAIAAVRENFATNPNASQAVAGPAGAAVLPKDIPVDVAQQMKSNTYKGLRGKYGVERGATIEAEKAGARALKEGIEQAAPEVAGLNAREGSLISLERALEDAMRRRGNYDVLGLKPTIGATTSVATQNPLPLLVTLVDRYPGLVSRAGIWINRTGSGKAVGRAGKATAIGTTTPTESRNRTTTPAWLAPSPAH